MRRTLSQETSARALITRMPPVRLIPLGGLGEVGMNALVVESAETRLLIDCGLMFPHAESALGVDVVIPDLKYLDERGGPTAVVLTHAHEDHIGALPYLLARHPHVPVYGTRFTLGVVKHRLAEFGLSPDFREIAPRERFQIGTTTVEALRVCHSTPDAVGLCIETPEGRLLHTGDFKLDLTPVDGERTDLRRFAELGTNGTAALLSDSTNAERGGSSISERAVAESFLRLFPQLSGRIIVAAFASNIHRVQSALTAAAACGRKAVVLGRSMQENVRLATDLGLLKYPSDLLVDPETLEFFKPHELVILTTGAQGEPRSGLFRMAHGEHKLVELGRGDTVILSSRAIPGNEIAVAGLCDELARIGVDLLEDRAGVGPFHATGHACQDEQRLLLSLVQPANFVPIHGEHRMLVAHARTAVGQGVARERCFVIEDGDVLELTNGAITKAPGRAPVGRIYLDGRHGDPDGASEITLRDRALLADAGLVLVVLAIDRKTGTLLRSPEIIGRGVSEDAALFATARANAETALASLPEDSRTDVRAVQEAVRAAVRRAFPKDQDRKRPMVLPLVVEL